MATAMLSGWTKKHTVQLWCRLHKDATRYLPAPSRLRKSCGRAVLLQVARAAGQFWLKAAKQPPRPDSPFPLCSLLIYYVQMLERATVCCHVRARARASVVLQRAADAAELLLYGLRRLSTPVPAKEA